jgi:hypothetical protein
MSPSTVRFLGFLAGFAVALAVTFVITVILHDLLRWRSFLPRGIGWFVMPFLWGIWWANAAPEWWYRLEKGEDGLSTKFRTSSKVTRTLIVGSAMWVLTVGLYVLMFDPYDSFTDFSHLLKVMSFPPMIGFAGLAAYNKFVAPETINLDVDALANRNRPSNSKHHLIPDDHNIVSLPASSLALQREVEHGYLNRLYANVGGWTLSNQTTLERKDRAFDKFEIVLGDGRTKTVWFDITEAWKRSAER